MSQTESVEVVHEGWLTKSPPSKSIWGARWRKRWFVLRHSGELPGQYFLCYYTDKSYRKLKGRIDLDQCEQVDAGLKFENRKQKYQHMFDVKTPKRTYYLAADSEQEMNKWVDCVCHVCGLKVYSQFEASPLGNNIANGDDETTSVKEDSPPVSPTSTASGPYIPISECISGKPLSSPDGLSHLLALQQAQLQLRRTDTYDAPRKLLPSQLELRNTPSNTPPLQSPATDPDSVFTDEEWVKPAVNWNTFPRPSDSSIEGDAPPAASQRFTRTGGPENVPTDPPPRPPKPSHLVASENFHNYLNLDNVSTEPQDNKGQLDEMYDFPRSHTLSDATIIGTECPVPQTRHCYSNAAPGNVNGNVFRYDLASTQKLNGQEENDSESPNGPLYSNLPTPPAPPFVNRDLKPDRRDSSASNEPSPVAPPNVDRKLKPAEKLHKLDKQDETILRILHLCNPPSRRQSNGNHSLRKTRAAPSPAPYSPVRRYSDIFDEECGFGLEDKIQYLDLALDSGSSTKYQVPVSTPSVYKPVDFLKTDAFTRTRKTVEEERKGLAIL